MKNCVFIKKWKFWYQRFPVLIRTTFMVTPVFFRRYLVQYPFCACLLFLGACTDVKGFTNMELGPYAKGPEVLKAFPTAEGFGKNATGGREKALLDGHCSNAHKTKQLLLFLQFRAK